MNRYNSSLGINRNDDCCCHHQSTTTHQHRNRSKSPYNTSQSPVRVDYHHHHNHPQHQHHHQNNNNNNQRRHNHHHKQQHQVHYQNPEKSTPTHRYLPVNHEPAPILGSFYEPLNQETFLRMKWVDNSPRMSRLRDHRAKRQINKLEQFELWDMEQSAKQKQFEQAREHRYKNIMDRLKCQEVCVNLMKKRHESDIETSRELEQYQPEYNSEDTSGTKYHGTISQFRKFENDMDTRLKSLNHDLDTLNPRHKIEQAILPRLERTRHKYSVEPEIFTPHGKKVLRRPTISSSRDVLDEHGIKYYYPAPGPLYNPKLKSIINNNTNTNNQNDLNEKSLSKMKITTTATTTTSGKAVNFNDDVEYNTTANNNDNIEIAPAPETTTTEAEA